MLLLISVGQDELECKTRQNCLTSLENSEKYTFYKFFLFPADVSISTKT